MLDVIGMVIHHVENHTNACLVKGVYHLLELTDAAQGVIGVSAIASLRHVIIHRVVTPVILRFVETGLINRAVIIAGQDMDIGDTQVLEVLNGPRLCQRQVLARIFCFRLVDREVTMVHLIDNNILRQTTHGLIVLPPFWISIVQINHHTFLTIDTHGLGKDARRSLSVDYKLIGLSLLITLGYDSPDTVAPQFHRQAVLSQYHHTTGIGGSKETEGCL